MLIYRSLALCWLALFCLGAASENVTSSGDNRSCRPKQVHLALTGDPTEMRVSWKTTKHGCRSVLQYADNQAVLASSNDVGLKLADIDEETTYGPEDMCGSPASGFDFSHLHLHTSVMTGLIPGRTHWYRIGDEEQVHHFRAAAAPGPEGGLTFLAFADMGESEHHRAKAPGAQYTAVQLEREVLENDADMLLHIGDISYANGDPDIWDTFMEEIEPYASVAPYMIGIGNHEYDYRTGKEQRSHEGGSDASGEDQPYDPDWGNYGNDSGGECGVTVSKRFHMPDVAPANGENHHRTANAPFWYSFEYGSVHFIILSSEHDLSHKSDQYKWLRQDLAAVDRCVTPWLIVGIHRPMYVVFPHKSNRIVGSHLRDSLEELFDEHQVDMVLSGHVHAYARTCNVYNERCVDLEDGGMTHITLGCGGRKLSDVEHEQPLWLEHAAKEWGYGRIHVVDGRDLYYDFVLSEDGTVADSLHLHNARSQHRSCNDLHAAAVAQAPASGIVGLISGGHAYS